MESFLSEMFKYTSMYFLNVEKSILNILIDNECTVNITSANKMTYYICGIKGFYSGERIDLLFCVKVV